MWIYNFLTTVCLPAVCICVLTTEIGVRLGNDAKMPCRLSSGEVDNIDNINVKWKSNKNSWLTSGLIVYKFPGRISVDKTTPYEWNLRIKNVDQSFADVYYCIANNKEISIITLKIDVAPKLNAEVSTPSDKSFQQYTTVELKCVFTGEPVPEVTWYRGYGDSKKPIGITGPILRVREVTRYATDLYTCRGQNYVNHYDHVINATVVFDPEVNVKEDKVYSLVSATAVLSCVIQGFPIRRVYWTDNNGKGIHSSNWQFKVIHELEEGMPVQSLTLVLRKASWGKRDFGTYTCIAEGETAEASRSVQLIEA